MNVFILFLPALSLLVCLDCKLCDDVLLDNVIEGDIEKVYKLTHEEDTDVSCTTPDRNTLLILALEKRRQNIAKLLIMNGADPGLENVAGENAKTIAQKHGDVKFLRFLDVWNNSRSACSFVLNHLICSEIYISNLSELDELLNFLGGYSSCCVDGYDEKNNSALFLAANRKYQKYFERVVKTMCHINITDQYSNGILHELIHQQNYEIVKWLLDKQPFVGFSNNHLEVDVRARDMNNNEIISIFAHNNRWDDVHYMLERYKLSPDTKDGHGDGLTHIALDMGVLDEVKKLIDAGADVNGKDMFNNTLIHTAISKNLWDLVDYLTKKGADLNIKDMFGNTAAHGLAYAAQWDRLNKAIDEGKVDVKAKDMYGRDIATILKDCNTSHKG